MFETALAAIGALVCMALLVHMALPQAQRQRLDTAARRLAWRLRTVWENRGGLRRRGSPAVKPGGANRAHRTDSKDQADIVKPAATSSSAQRAVERAAEQEALDVIERARRQSRDKPAVTRDGNVLRPDAFKPRPPKDRLH